MYEYSFEDKPGRLASKSFSSLQEVEDYLSDWQYLPVICRRKIGTQDWVPCDEWYLKEIVRVSFLSRAKSFFQKFAG